MSTTDTSIKFGFKESEPKLIEIIAGDKTYGLNHETGDLFLGGIKKEGEEAATILKNIGAGVKPAYEELLKRGEVRPAQIDTFKQSITHLNTKIATGTNPAFDHVAHAMSELATLEAELAKGYGAPTAAGAKTFVKLEEASVKSVTNILAKREGLDRLISNDNQRILNKAETGGIEITRRVGSMRDTVKALGDALASKTYSEDSIRSILAKGETGAVAHLKPEMKTDFAKYVHHEDAAKRIQGFDIEALAGEVEQKAEGLQKQAKELANKVLKLHNERASDTKIKAAADELRELESKNPDYVRRIGKSVNDHLSETEREIFKKIKGAEGLMESYSKAASSGTASSTTSKGRGFVSTILYKNEEALGKVASELKKPVSELSTWQKIHGGKLAGWAIAAGVVAYIAGIGRNPDSGKYTSAENERRATPSSQQIGA